MATEVFNRYEAKYLIDKLTYHSFERAISEYVVLDKYNKDNKSYTVANIYYDTDDFYLIRTSLEKPIYKEKLRLRAYGVPDLDTLVFCEIKKKFKGKVYKRRSKIMLKEAYNFVQNKKLDVHNRCLNEHVLDEIEWFLSRNDLKPKVYLSYSRKAYFGKDDRRLRISFDNDIRYRLDDLRLESGTDGEQLLDSNLYLMEIKCFNMPFWLTEILTDLKIYPRSFSKYGRVYRDVICKMDNAVPIQESEAATTIVSDK